MAGFSAEYAILKIFTTISRVLDSFNLGKMAEIREIVINLISRKLNPIKKVYLLFDFPVNNFKSTRLRPYVAFYPKNIWVWELRVVSDSWKNLFLTLG